MHDEVLDLLTDLSCLPGIGVDAESVERWNDPDLRLFSEEERDHCLALANPAEGFAGRWCAKEAVVKAMSPFETVTIRDVGILVGTRGEPLVRLTRRDMVDAVHVVVSITHTKTVAVAVAAARTLSGQVKA